MQTPSTIVSTKATYNGSRSINIRYSDVNSVRVCRDSIISLTKQVIFFDRNLVARSVSERNLDKH